MKLSRKFIVLMVFIFGPLALANEMAETDQAARKFAEEMQANAEQNMEKGSAEDFQFLQAQGKDSAERARWQANMHLEEKNMAEAAALEAENNAASQHVLEASKNNSRYPGLAQEAWIQQSEEISQNAAKIVNPAKDETFKVPRTANSNITKSKYNCEMSRAAETRTCERYLVEPSISHIPAKYSTCWCGESHERVDELNSFKQRFSWRKGVRQRHLIRNLLEPSKVLVGPEVWHSNCAALENLAQSKLVGRICLEKDRSREIQGTEVFKPCWREQLSYSIYHPSKNNCGPYLRPGCHQVASSCQIKVGGICQVWDLQFNCLDQEPTIIREPLSAQAPAFVNDDPKLREVLPNEELSSSMAQLSIFNELQQNKIMHKNAEGFNPEIFKGSDERCTIDFFNCRNCCKTAEGGWGVNLNLTSCSSAEKNLDAKKQKNLCVEVGTHCKKKILGACLVKERTYCCFPSKLVKQIQVQGRLQDKLRLTWGSAKAPLCRGFTETELQNIDFQKLDLSADDIFKGIEKKVKKPDVESLEQRAKEHLERMRGNFGSKQTNNGGA